MTKLYKSILKIKTKYVEMMIYKSKRFNQIKIFFENISYSTSSGILCD